MSIRSSLLLLCALVAAPASAQTLTPRCPNLLMVFDVSGSMRTTSTTAKDGTQKQLYVVGREAVTDLLLTAGDTSYRWGLELFGDSTQPAGACGISPATCSYPTPATCNSVTADYGTADEINAVLAKLNNSNVTGSTPTGAAMETAATRTDMNDTQRGRYAVLITDGNPSGCSDSLNRATTALTALRDQKGVKTYVLGFVGGTPDNLNAMAVAGGTPRQASCTNNNDRCYYEASNAQELQTALAAILSAVGGEFGGAGCDDSCYAQGCNTGEICKGGTCQADPCASVTCGANQACVDGACQAYCTEACKGATPLCQNGQCVAQQDCTPACSGRNEICVAGQCQEDYCSTGVITCEAGFQCIRNACQKSATSTPKPDGGSGTDGGSDGDGGTSDGGGCCTGAPGAFSLLGLLFALSSLQLLRRRA